MKARNCLPIAWIFVLLFYSGCLFIDKPAGSQPSRNRHDEVATKTANLGEDESNERRRQVLETLFAYACAPQTSFGRHDRILVSWPAELPVAGELAIRIMTASGRIYLERHAFVEAETVLKLSYAYQLPVGAYDIVVMPTPGEYHVGGLRISRKIAIQVNHMPERTLLADNPCQ